MRIALIGPAHPDRGAAARHTTELAYRLATAGHNVIIESWRAPGRAASGPAVSGPAASGPAVSGPAASGPAASGPAASDQADGEEYPRTYRRLAWYRPDGWIAAGRRLRSADLVVFALVSQAQVPSYLSVLTALALGPDRPRTTVICHLALPSDRLTGTLLARADTVIVHSAAQAAQARVLAPDVPIVIARMPPRLPPVPAGVRPPDPEPYWSAYLHALGA